MERAYFRSMSKREYNKWKRKGGIAVGTEWTELMLSKTVKGYPLSELKTWVDEGKNEWGPHDVVIEVTSSDALEFDYATRGDRFGHETDELMQPLRYRNLRAIGFKRVRVIYDPRGLVSKEPVLELNEMVKGFSLWGWVKGWFGK
ncbi:hypothetical protein HOD38_00365 [archaeon]|jgi:hypothetical protein|nr:hypothetical protein [archaeon]MBT4396700.1 hypothetical protein [archaeon]MBT4441310.1 hypothetical protein [archaeon]